MKILAIRGENLASLSAIDVDFERDPLARAGLFAICGPTGAGKSTILDALCVALFDKTPRLHGGKGRVLVGHAEQSKDSRVAANDVRGLLRRGAGEGWAEVDFLGRDARRYRARWAVWRARRKPDGRLQNQVMSLTDLGSGDDLSSSKKTETLAAIETRLGLSFDQFRRSALLAQGEFAAFLRADDSERSALLERMTGTGIYGDLSRAAHERHKEERAELDEIAGQVERHAVLDDDERQRVESERTQLTDELSTIAARRERAQRAADWHLRRDQLVADERAARAALDDATRAWQAAEPQRAELDRVVRARAYRPVLAADDRAKAAVVRVAAEL
ncbi:MAG: AAA family ATPase, partial [Myxococcota bacterium]